MLSAFTLLNSCNVKENEKIYHHLKFLCNQMNLHNCYVELKYSYGFNSNENDELIINIEETSKINDFYRKYPYSLMGKVSYEVYQYMDSVEYNKMYSNIRMTTVINKKKISSVYSISKLKLTKELINTVNIFLENCFEGNAGFAKDYIDEKHIPDSIFNSILTGVNHMAECGDIIRIDLMGLSYDKIKETEEEVTIIEKYVKRVNSEELFTIYMSNKDNKIIYINAQSTMKCKN